MLGPLINHFLINNDQMDLNGPIAMLQGMIMLCYNTQIQFHGQKCGLPTCQTVLMLPSADTIRNGSQFFRDYRTAIIDDF